MEDDRDILDGQEEGPEEKLAPEPAGSSLYKQADRTKEQLSKIPNKNKPEGLKDGKDKLAKSAEKGGKKAAGTAEGLAEKGAKLPLPQAKVVSAAAAAFNAARGKKANKGPLFALLFIVICIISLLVIIPSFAVFYFLKTPPSDASEITVPGIPTTGELLTPPNLGQPNSAGYYDMPPSTDGSYIIYSCQAVRSGKIELIQVLYTVAIEFAKKYPNNKLRIGDLTGNPGGHVSHRNGIDVDVVIPGGMMSASPYNPQLAVDAGKLFFSTKMIDRIFYNDTNVQNEINSYAKQNNLPGVMKSWPNHANHFHLRINLPKGPLYAPSC